MAEDTGRTKIWRVIPLLLIILVMLVGGGIALAGVPAAVPAGIGVAPPAQGKGNGTNVAPQQGAWKPGDTTALNGGATVIPTQPSARLRRSIWRRLRTPALSQALTGMPPPLTAPTL